MLAAHDAFAGGSLLPFHKRSVVEKKKAEKKKKKRKIKEIQEEKEKKARIDLEISIRNKILLEMSATQSTHEIVQEDNVWEEGMLETNKNNTNNPKKKKGVCDRTVYDRATLKARNSSRVSLRPFLKSRK